MTRQKVKMAFIENETARKSTYKKRKSGLLKKSHELATLCGVPVCVFMNSDYELNTQVWPTREGANRIVSQWNMLPPMDKTKKMVNLESYLQQRISKAADSLRRLRRENRELEMTELIFGIMSGKFSLDHVDKSVLPDLFRVIDQYLKEVNHNMEIAKTNDVPPPSSVAGGRARAGARAAAAAAGARAAAAAAGARAAAAAAAGGVGAGGGAGAGAGAGAAAVGAGAGAAAVGAAAAAVAGVGAVTTANFMPMPVVDMGSSAAEFYDRIRIQIENTLTLKQSMLNLDLNKE